MLSSAKTDPRKPPQGSTARQWDWWRWMWAVPLGILTLCALSLLIVSTWVLPGVYVLDLNLGGRTRTEAATLLERYWYERTILLAADDEAFTVTPGMLGVTLDAKATIDRAYRRGQSLNRVKHVLQEGGRVSVSPVLSFDPVVAESTLRAIGSQVAIPPADAAVHVADGRAYALPSIVGRALDVDATVDHIERHMPQIVQDGRAGLVVAAVPPTIADVSALVGQVNQWLASDLTVRAYDPVADEVVLWTVESDTWGAWASLDLDPRDQSGFEFQIDTQKGSAFLVAKGSTLGPDRYLDIERGMAAIGEAIEAGNWSVWLRVYHRPQEHIVQAGETVSSIARDHGIPYPYIQEVNPGVGDSLRVGQSLAIPSPDVLLPLPVVENKRIVVSISRQAMWVYENGALLWVWPVSTGIPSSPTSPGVFQILSHERNAYAGSWDLWMPYFMGIYRPTPDTHVENGFHGFPARDGASLLWTGDLGHPVTFGCILISTQNAAWLYDWAEEGVVVEVQP